MKSTYGYDQARANAHIHRMTGKWGKLKTHEEVEKYIASHDLTERPSTIDEAKPQRALYGHNVDEALRYDLKVGIVTISTVSETGEAVRVQKTTKTEREGEGTVWQCYSDDKFFKTWGDFLTHALEMRRVDRDTEKSTKKD